MSFTNKHPVISLITAVSLCVILAFIAAVAVSMVQYYRTNYVDEFKIPEDREQMVIKKSNNVNL